jgi:hypothetical protein
VWLRKAVAFADKQGFLRRSPNGLYFWNWFVHCMRIKLYHVVTIAGMYRLPLAFVLDHGKLADFEAAEELIAKLELHTAGAPAADSSRESSMALQPTFGHSLERLRCAYRV